MLVPSQDLTNMMLYRDFRPTGFDSHIDLEDRENWIVVRCTRTRDSGCFDESNFHSALEILGGESDRVEVHRFGHWGPGWFEIILADPSLSASVEEIESSLADYPILDENDLSERELEAENSDWNNWGEAEILSKLKKEFVLQIETVNWLTESNTSRLYNLYQDHTSGTEHTDEGSHFPDSWISRMSRGRLAAWIRATKAAERAASKQ